MKPEVAIFFLFLLVEFCEGAKILMMMPSYTKSHNTIFEVAAKTLGERGHKVTLVTPYPLKKPLENVEHYRLGDDSKLNENDDFDFFDGPKFTPIGIFWGVSDFFTIPCEAVYKHEKIQELITYISHNKGAKVYDVAFVEMMPTECLLPLASLVANHTVFLSVLNVPFWVAIEMRIPVSLSTVPMVCMTETGMPKTFYDRFTNAYNSIVVYFIWKFNIVPEMQTIADKYLPSGSPRIFDVLRKVSFVFTNVNSVTTTPRALVPFVGQIGGIHLQPPNPLSKELEEFMQSSGDDGVILFSFGSFVNTRSITNRIRNMFLGSFRRLKQKILWKYHEQIPGAPKNLKIMPWLPQTDLLAHPKLRLFITHGGALSTQELIFYGKPILGVPLVYDQLQNAAVIRDFGLGELLSLRDATAEEFHNTLVKVLEGEKYYKKAKEAAAIFRDQQNSPADVLNYWTEYVIRHNGAAHLKNEMAENLYFFQYLLMDVLAFVLAVVLAVTIALVFAVKFLLKVSRKKSKQKRS